MYLTDANIMGDAFFSFFFACVFHSLCFLFHFILKLHVVRCVAALFVCRFVVVLCCRVLCCVFTSSAFCFCVVVLLLWFDVLSCAAQYFMLVSVCWMTVVFHEVFSCVPPPSNLCRFIFLSFLPFINCPMHLFGISDSCIVIIILLFHVLSLLCCCCLSLFRVPVL